MTTALLKHLIAVYRTAFEADWCNQSKDLHRAIADDAEWTLARHTGTLLGNPTVHAQSTLKGAIREVCSELVVCCMSDRRGVKRRQTLSHGAAKKNAAELVGVPYEDFSKLYNGVIPRGLAVKGQVA
jgi:hypothetical protein